MTTRRKSDTQVSSDNVVEFPKTSHAHGVFTWLKVVNFDPNLQPSDFKVAFDIAERTDTSGTCYPGIQTIADRTALNKKTILVSVDRLAAAGYLAVEKGSRGCGTSNRYRLITPQEKVRALHLFEEAKRSNRREEKVHSAPEKGVASTPEPLTNHYRTTSAPLRGARYDQYLDSSAPNGAVNSKKPSSQRFTYSMSEKDRENFESILERRPLPLGAFNDPIGENKAKSLFKQLTKLMDSREIDQIAAQPGGPPTAVEFLDDLLTRERRVPDFPPTHRINPSIASKGFQVSLGSS
jgi:hypothetical protein